MLMLLAGCGGRRATYTLMFNVNNDTLREELIWSALRLMERTAEKLETRLLDKEVTPGAGSGAASVTVALQSAKSIPLFTEELTRPFTLAFMLEAPKGPKTLDVEGHGSFQDTGVGQHDVFWAESAADPLTGKGAVRLLFTKEGYEKLRVLLDKNKKKSVGLFVRGRLVSTLTAESLKEHVVIQGIPSGELASAFADEVNVGLHVTIAPAS